MAIRNPSRFIIVGIQIFAVSFLTSCKSTVAPLTAAEWAELDKLVEDRNFSMEARWAEPTPDNSLNQMANAGLLPPGSSPSRINLEGNANYFRMKGDSVAVQLPFWGERQVIQAYGSAEGITYEGPVDDLEVVKNESQSRYDVNFTLRNESERLQCNLKIFKGNRALLTVNSTQRNSIRYEGTIQPAEE
jgi:hypothetical protein